MKNILIIGLTFITCVSIYVLLFGYLTPYESATITSCKLSRPYVQTEEMCILSNFSQFYKHIPNCFDHIGQKVLYDRKINELIFSLIDDPYFMLDPY